MRHGMLIVVFCQAIGLISTMVNLIIVLFSSDDGMSRETYILVLGDLVFITLTMIAFKFLRKWFSSNMRGAVNRTLLLMSIKIYIVALVIVTGVTLYLYLTGNSHYNKELETRVINRKVYFAVNVVWLGVMLAVFLMATNYTQLYRY